MHEANADSIEWELDNSTITIINFNTALSLLYRTGKKKIN